MIIKFNNKITFGNSQKSFDYSDIDELYNSKTVDNIILKEEWYNIEDILIDMAFSVNEDKVRIIENINATMKMENQALTKDDKKMLEHYADNKITLEEAINIIKESILNRV